MPKVRIKRKGAKPALVDARLAHHLVTNTRIWSYAEDTKIHSAKRAPKKQPAVGGDAPQQSRVGVPITEAEEAQAQTTKPEAVALSSLPKGLTMSASPMTSRHVKVAPMRKAVMSREQLQDMTKADLKVLGEKLGIDLKASEAKDQWVNRLTRYMRRDMRAER